VNVRPPVLDKTSNAIVYCRRGNRVKAANGPEAASSSYADARCGTGRLYVSIVPQIFNPLCGSRHRLEGFAGNEACGVVCEEGGGDTDIVTFGDPKLPRATLHGDNLYVEGEDEPYFRDREYTI
jgi:hypothetical protein